jgi:hypothetical protein
MLIKILEYKIVKNQPYTYKTSTSRGCRWGKWELSRSGREVVQTTIEIHKIVVSI